jgi:hypothetical protein
MNFLAEVAGPNHDLFEGPAILTRVNKAVIEHEILEHEELAKPGSIRYQTEYLCGEINLCLSHKQSDDLNERLILAAYPDQHYLDELEAFDGYLGENNKLEVISLIEKAQHHLHNWLSESNLDNLVLVFRLYEIPLPKIVADRIPHTQPAHQEPIVTIDFSEVLVVMEEEDTEASEEFTENNDTSAPSVIETTESRVSLVATPESLDIEKVVAVTATV